jgi:tripartite-type tricarboxylate transporter receptor subunit TctC
LIFQFVLAAASLLIFSTAANAAYPERPIRILVPFPPGGNVDITARIVAPGLSSRLGQAVIVDNRGGAHGTIAAEIVAKAARDGYTLMLTSGGMLAIAPALYQKLSYDIGRDFAPIGSISTVPLVMLVHQSSPIKTVREFITTAKARPGRITMATNGSGSTPDLAGALFQSLTGTKLIPVPYKGSGPAQIDLAGGQVEVYFDQLSAAIAFVNGGKTRALAVTSKARVAQLPDVPTMGDAGVPGCEATTFTGLLAPTGTPREIIDRLNAAMNNALRTDSVRESFARFAGQTLEGTPEDFARLMRDETAKWTQVVRAAGIKGE